LTANSTTIQHTASWAVQTGLGNSGCYSFESVDTPGSYIRHSNYELMLDADDGSMLFADDASFCPEVGLGGHGNSLRSWSYPTRYWRHYNSILYIASNCGPFDFDATALFNDDVL
jgi:hypothetical protein